MADYNSAYTGEEIDAAVGNAKTAADLKTAYESNADTNAFTDAQQAKLANQSGVNTGDQNISGIAINALDILALESEQITQNSAIALNTAKRTYPLVDENKLAGIESGAEVNAVDSVFGRTGAVTAQIGDYTKSDVGLGNVDNTSDVNKPISTPTQIALDAKQGSLTLTTTGTSGASTLIGDTLNIPNYAGGGGAVDSVNGETGVVVLDTSDIAATTDKNYVTDAELTTLSNTSGTNTGDQDISGIATNASAISTLDGEVVKKADYDTAHSILVQQSGTGAPETVTLSNNELLGKDGSVIKGYSASDIRTLINVEDGAQVNTINAGDNVSELINDAGYVESDTTGVTGADAITNIMSLTQAEYDAIVTPDASTLYIING